MSTAGEVRHPDTGPGDMNSKHCGSIGHSSLALNSPKSTVQSRAKASMRQCGQEAKRTVK